MATIDVTEPWATRRIEAPTYVLSRWLFLRLLGVVYLVAFLSLVPQVTGLVGEHGLLPARPFLDRAFAIYGGAAYRLFPTLCWLGASDATLQALCWAGVALALLLIAGASGGRSVVRLGTSCVGANKIASSPVSSSSASHWNQRNVCPATERER